MSRDKQKAVLLVGGSGLVGAVAAETLRALHPTLPIAIGGRDAAKAGAVAARIGNADAVRIDLARPDLGLPAQSAFSALVMFVKDTHLHALPYAQRQGAAYVDLQTMAFEIAPEVAHFVRHPDRSAVVLAEEWLAGAAALATLHFAAAYASLESIAIGAVLDEQDIGGPAAYADFQRITAASSQTQLLRDGRWISVDAQRDGRPLVTVDGTELIAQPYATLDAVSLAARTDARSIRFDAAVGESVGRRRGEHFSTEIIIELAGTGRDGKATRSRHEIFHPRGQAPVTAAAVAVIVERLLGLVGAPVPPGLYFPDIFIEPAHMLERLQAFGAQIRTA
jgi:hypothetical protein